MRIRTLLAASVLGAMTVAAPARASHRDRADGVGLAYDLRTSTARLHESADLGLRGGGFRGAAAAGTLHRMDEWADYYVKAVERHGFRSRMARQRFDRFLVEYRDACRFLDRGRPGYEVARLQVTVDRISRSYGVDVAWDRDRGNGGGWEDDRSRRGRW